MDAVKLSQFEVSGRQYTPAYPTAKKMPAGIYTIGTRMGQLFFEQTEISTDNILRLPDSKSDEVVSEVEKFWGQGEKYAEYGFVHKRGFLLHGPPGSGKTSTIAILCDYMTKNDGLVVMGNTNPSLVSKGLQQLREADHGRHVMVILEDIDAIIDMYGEQELLSLLDGESSVPGVIYVATTNYIDQLAPRIKNRPSRFDRVVEIGMPNDNARLLYLKSRKLGLAQKQLGKWVKATKGFSIAQLKEVIVAVYCMGAPFGDVVKRLKKAGRDEPKADMEYRDDDVAATAQ